MTDKIENYEEAVDAAIAEFIRENAANQSDEKRFRKKIKSQKKYFIFELQDFCNTYTYTQKEKNEFIKNIIEKYAMSII